MKFTGFRGGKSSLQGTAPEAQGSGHFPSPLLRFGVLFLPALLFAVKSDLPHVLLLSGILILAPVFMKKPLEYREREIIYSTLLTLLMILLPDIFFRMDASRLGLTDAVIRSDLSAPFFLYAAGFLMLFRRTALSRALSAAFSVFVSLLCGDIFSTRNLINVRFAAGSLLLEHFAGFYGITVLLQCVFILFLIAPSSESEAVSRQKNALPLFPFFPRGKRSARQKKSAGRKVEKENQGEKDQAESSGKNIPGETHGKGFPFRSRTPVLLKGFYFLLIPCFILGFLHIYTANRENLKKLEMFLIRLNASLEQKGMESAPRPRRTTVNLNYLHSNEEENRGGRILIWAKADSPPGYLRTEVFHSYSGGSWLKASTGETEMTGLPHAARGAFQAPFSSPSSEFTSAHSDTFSSTASSPDLSGAFRDFILPPGNSSGPGVGSASSTGSGGEKQHPGKTVLKLFLDDSLQYLPLPVPGNAGLLTLPLPRITASDDGEIHASRWSGGIPYTVRLSSPEDFAAWPMPSFPYKKEKGTEETEKASFAVYTEVPAEILPALDALKNEIFPEGKKENIREKSLQTVHAVAGHLRTRFQYTLDAECGAVPEGVDPVSDFILRTRSGHCEFFASTAALLFRRLGFPSRYVCGYLCIQPHPCSGHYFYATGKNAHAWCEVYLQEYGRWIPVEPSPASVFENMIRENDRHVLSAYLDSLRYFLREFLARSRESDPGEMLLLSGKWGLILLFRSPLGPILICAAGIFLWRKWRKKRKRENHEQSLLGENVRLIRREMSRMERLAGQYAGIPPRADSETMREWISRMNHFPSSLKDSLMKLEELYESLRFRSGDASEEERALFLEECRMRRRTWKNLLRSSTAAEKKD